MAAPLAIATCAALAHAGPAPVQDYRPVFQACRRADGVALLAIRRMRIGGQVMFLGVDPATLKTRLQRDQDWSCADTTDEKQKNTRYLRAIRASGTSAAPPDSAGIIANGGILRGTPPGAFITGDLCPSRRPLDRAFVQRLETLQSPLPLALSMSGLWLARHHADFQWLRDQEQTGALQLTWVDHSYHHPYFPGRPYAENFLLARGIDMRAEILDTERVLIANGETPSVFFRFPGLISNPALMRAVADNHLIVLGAAAWLAKSPRARAGDIILLHLNGNEPAGLRIFSTLRAAQKLPEPFRGIGEAPDVQH